ncbi:MAG: replicative DNA helicase, partial [Actinobacteria bacterium]|nr:replicative DNA helicase [Actinomycetota bacterium]
MAVAVAADRLPPQNLDAERSLLGSLLIDPDAMLKITGKVTAEDFYREQHRAVYDAIAGLASRGERADIVTVCEELTRRDRLDDAGGVTYVSDLIVAVPTAFHVEHYAAIVRRASILRRIIQGAGQMASEAYKPGADAHEVLDAAERVIFGIANEARTRDFEPIREILHRFRDELDVRMENRMGPTGVATGLRQLDLLTGGLQRGDLLVLAARPGGGKTALSLNLAVHAAKHNDVGVGYFSLEMPSEQIAQRILGAEARINAMRIRDGRLDPDEYQLVAHTMSRIAEYPIYVDDSPGLNVLELRSKARRLQMEHNIGLVVIDYLQLMNAASAR